MVRGHKKQARALSLCQRDRVSGSYAKFPGQSIFCQDDAMAVCGIARNRERLIAQSRLQYRLSTGVKRVRITEKHNSVHIIHLSRK